MDNMITIETMKNSNAPQVASSMNFLWMVKKLKHAAIIALCLWANLSALGQTGTMLARWPFNNTNGCTAPTNVAPDIIASNVVPYSSSLLTCGATSTQFTHPTGASNLNNAINNNSYMDVKLKVANGKKFTITSFQARLGATATPCNADVFIQYDATGSGTFTPFAPAVTQRATTTTLTLYTFPANFTTPVTITDSITLRIFVATNQAARYLIIADFAVYGDDVSTNDWEVLRAAIANYNTSAITLYKSNSGETENLAAGKLVLQNNINFINSSGTPISINRDVKIQSADGTPITLYTTANRHFNINTANRILSFENVILDGSRTSGGISIGNFNDVFIRGAVIQNCYNSTNGGAIVSSNNNLFTVENCAFLNNRAGSGGGAIFAANALTATNCTFEGNRASATGGAIRMDRNNGAAVATITNCTFYRDTATTQGGAIWAAANSPTYIRLSTFNANVANNASNAGAAVFFNGNTVKQLHGNIFYGNTGAGNEIFNNPSGANATYNIVGTNVALGANGNFVDQIAAGKTAGDIFASTINNTTGVLADNGGPTKTIKILKGGLADAVIPAEGTGGYNTAAYSSTGGTPDKDQRGVERNTEYAIGAFDLGVPPPGRDTIYTNRPATQIDLTQLHTDCTPFVLQSITGAPKITGATCTANGNILTYTHNGVGTDTIIYSYLCDGVPQNGTLLLDVIDLSPLCWWDGEIEFEISMKNTDTVYVQWVAGFEGAGTLNIPRLLNNKQLMTWEYTAVPNDNPTIKVRFITNTADGCNPDTLTFEFYTEECPKECPVYESTTDNSLKGKEFWMAFPPGSNNYSSIHQLRFVAEEETDVTIHFAYNDSTVNVHINAGEVEIYQLKTGAGNEVAGIQLNYNNIVDGGRIDNNRAIRITATKDIVAYALSHDVMNADATILYPVALCGKDYFHAGYRPAITYEVGTRPHRDGYMVVATENNTTVTDPSGSRVIHKGQVYSYYGLDGKNDTSGMSPSTIGDYDLTGAHVTANKPVAFFAANTGAQVPATYRYADKLYHQWLSVDKWGTEFFIPATVQSKMRIRVIAAYDGTDIDIPGCQPQTSGAWDLLNQTGIMGPIVTEPQNPRAVSSSIDPPPITGGRPTGSQSSLNNLQAGQYVEIDMGANANGCYIKSNLPVMTVAYMVSSADIDSQNEKLHAYNAIAGEGDPSIAWVPPMEHFTNKITLSRFDYMDINGYGFDKHYVQIMTPTATKENTTLTEVGGTTVTLTPSPTVQWYDNSGLSYCNYKITNNSSYTIENPDGVVVTSYGTGRAVSYHYLAGSSGRTLYPMVTINGDPYYMIDSATTTYSGCDPIFFKATTSVGMIESVIWKLNDVELTDYNTTPPTLNWDTILPAGKYVLDAIIETNDYRCVTLRARFTVEECAPDYAQVLMCYPNTAINMKEYHPECTTFEVTGVSNPYISGATAQAVDSTIVYAPSTPGMDTVTYTFTCNGGDPMNGILYIYVAECPDNIDTVSCYGYPEPTPWGIKELNRTTRTVHPFALPLVGDIDGCGRNEVLVFETYPREKWATNSHEEWYSEKVLILNDQLQLIDSIEIPLTFVDGSFPIAIANVDPEVDNLAEIFILTGSGATRTIECYNYDGTSVTKKAGFIESNITVPFVHGDSELQPNPQIVIADINGDGVPELFVYDRIINAQNGTVIAALPAGSSLAKTYDYPGSDYYIYFPVLADVDNDGVLEIVCGNEVYKASIDEGSMTGTLALAYKAPQIPGLADMDGIVSVADIDLDGYLDVVVTTSRFVAEDANTITFTTWAYAWSPYKGIVLGDTAFWKNTITKNKHNDDEADPDGISRAFIGDVNGDGYPEIAFTYHLGMTCYRWNDTIKAFKQMWNKFTTDGSGFTSMTMFDFNQNGKQKIVYRDESNLRIIDGITGENLITFPSLAATGSEYPIVVDLMREGYAQILTTAATGAMENIEEVYLVSYGSVLPGAWALARPVWNQHAYNSVHINDDLTVPRIQMNPATVFAGKNETLGDSDDVRPFNGFLMQQTILNQYGVPYWPMPHIVWINNGNDTIPNVVVDFAGDSAVFKGCIQNIGSAAMQTPIYYTLYQNDTLMPPGTIIRMDSINRNMKVGEILCFEIVLKNLSTLTPLTSVWVSINDKNGDYPYQPQCEVDGRWEFPIEPRNDYAQVLMCYDSTAINMKEYHPACTTLTVTNVSNPKIGIKANAVDSTIVYYHNKITGMDTVTYTFTCNGTPMNGILYIKVVPCPDNIDVVDCWDTIVGFQFAIREVFNSTTICPSCPDSIATYVSPIVGDLDGDGIPEIVVARWNDPANSNTFRKFTNLYVFPGNDRTNVITIETPNGNYLQAGAIAMARVPISDTLTPLIVMIDENGYLRAYNPYQTSGAYSNPKQVWISDSTIVASYDKEEDWGSVAFANFNGDSNNQIYVAGRIFDAATGKFIVEIPGNKGATRIMGNTPVSIQYMPTVGDIDGCGKLEYIAGNEIYKVDIDNKTVTLFKDIPPIEVTPSVYITDGHTFLADFNNDGHLDVLVVKSHYNALTTRYAMAIWDIKDQTVLGVGIDTTYGANYRGIPFIGDVDGDGELEILMTSARLVAPTPYESGHVNGYRLDLANGTINREYRLIIDDYSGSTGITLFDFNNDGVPELVYRDETSLRILKAENGTFTDVATIGGVTSGTFYEHAIVADMDNDGSAEIITVGGTDLQAIRGSLRIYKSGNQFSWAPARPVWNQYAYNVVNINNDLTIPQYRMNSATLFQGKDEKYGTSDDLRPYNNFLQQQSLLNQYGVPYSSMPHIVWFSNSNDTIPHVVVDFAGDSAVFKGCIQNTGSAALQSPLYYTLYKNDTLSGSIIKIDSIDMMLMAGEIFCFEIVLKDLANLANLAPLTSVWVSINDKNGIYPYQPQCEVEGRWEFIIPDPPLGDCIEQDAVSTMGTDFWVSFATTTMNTGNYITPSVNGSSYLHEVRIVTGAEPATINFYFTDNNTLDKVLPTIPPNTVYTYELNDVEKAATYNYLDNQNTGTINKKSLHITSSSPVSVYVLQQTAFVTDATNLLPSSSWGSDYYQISYEPLRYGAIKDNYSISGRDGFIVIAKENGTTVYKNSTFAAYLDAGQTYYFQGPNPTNMYQGYPYDLTGAHITSDKPVAYFVANTMARIWVGATAGDPLLQQLPPVEQWGMEFVVPNTMQQTGRVRVLAAHDGTVVTQSGATSMMINPGKNSYNLDAGEFCELEITGGNGCYITANNPVGVCAYLVGYSYSPAPGSNKGDPAVVWLPPVTQTMKSIMMAPFIPTAGSISQLKDHFATVITPTATKANTAVGINADPLISDVTAGITWKDNVGGSDYSFGTMQVYDSTYQFVNPAGLFVLGYGLGKEESYYYVGGSATRVLSPTLTVNGIPYDETDTFDCDTLTFRAFSTVSSILIDDVVWTLDGVMLTAKQGIALWDTILPEGTHVLEARIDYDGNCYKLTSTFTVTGCLTNLYAQVTECLPETPINLKQLLGCNTTGNITVDAGPYISGATATVTTDSTITYKYAALGYDSLTYSITCNGSPINGILYINIAECPDNVDSVDCWITIEAHEWSIQGTSTSELYLPYQTPIVGDVDGCGIPEILVAKNLPYDVSGNEKIVNAIAIYKGNDLTTVWNTIELKSPFYGNRFTRFGIVKTKIDNITDTVIIVVAESDRYLRAYNYEGDMLWKSDVVYHTTITDGNSPGFADFNHDGIPEIMVNGKIFDSRDGHLLCATPDEQQYPHCISIAADLFNTGELNFIVGNKIYTPTAALDALIPVMELSLTVDPTDTVPSALGTRPAFTSVGASSDDGGRVSVADLDNDGQLELIYQFARHVSNATYVGETFIAVVDPRTGDTKASKYFPYAPYSSWPFVGDIDGCGKPEIVFISSRANAVDDPNEWPYMKMHAYKYDPTKPLLQKFWTIEHRDGSGMTGMTLFDFNQDGIMEIVYRDEQNIRIINGSMISHITGADTIVYNLGSRPNTAGTGAEYPVVADVDGDGQAEIVIVGGTSYSGGDYGDLLGELWVYKSGDPHQNPWAPARPVWNQHAYNVVHINEDLTVPKYQMSPAAVFAGEDGILGTSDDIRPFNAFFQQQTYLNQYGLPYMPAAHIVWINNGNTVPDMSPIAGDSIVFRGCIKNIGDVALQAPIYYTLYKNDTLPSGSIIKMDSINVMLMAGETYCFTIVLKDIAMHSPYLDPLTSVWISINDKNGDYPYQPQCDVDGRWEFQIPTPYSNACEIPDWERLRMAVNIHNADTITIYVKNHPTVTEDLAAGRLVLCDYYNWIDVTSLATANKYGASTITIDVKREVVIRSEENTPGPSGKLITLYTRIDSVLSTGMGNTRHFNVTVSTGDLTLTNIVVHGLDTAGGVEVYGALTINEGAVIQNCFNSENGGGVQVEQGTITMNDGLIYSNEAGKRGGGVFLNNNTFTMVGGVISFNTAVSGGGVYLAGGNMNMTDGFISNNFTAPIPPNPVPTPMPDIDGYTFKGSGGGILNAGTGIVTISGTAYINSNTALRGGGIANINTGMVTMLSGFISGNTASGSSGYEGGGGIISYSRDNSYGTVNISGGTIRGNYTNGTGGGIDIRGTLTISDSAIIGGTDTLATAAIDGDYSNRAARIGGGVHLRGQSPRKMIMSDNVKIINNTANQRGGGIHSAGVRVEITGGTISGNLAVMDGGGISATTDAVVDMENAVITNNKAIRHGGGIYASDTVHLKNVAITNNTANCNNGTSYPGGYHGGGIFMSNPRKLTTSGTITFSENRTQTPYWVQDNSTSYTPPAGSDISPATGSQIILYAATYTALRSPENTFSAPPAGKCEFLYAYNNYDVNWTQGDTVCDPCNISMDTLVSVMAICEGTTINLTDNIVASNYDTVYYFKDNMTDTIKNPTHFIVPPPQTPPTPITIYVQAVSGDCDSVVSFIIIPLEKPTIDADFPDFCAGKQYDLTEYIVYDADEITSLQYWDYRYIPTGGTFTWNKIVDETAFTPTTGLKKIKLIITNKNGCTNEQDFIINDDEYSNLPEFYPFLAKDTSVCQNTLINLFGMVTIIDPDGDYPEYTLEFYDEDRNLLGDYEEEGSGNAPPPIPFNFGTDTVEIAAYIKYKGGCDDTVTFKIMPKPKPEIAASDTTVCKNEIIDLTGIPTTSGSIDSTNYYEGVSTIKIPDPTNYTATKDTTITVVAYLGDCDSAVTFRITVLPLLTPTFGFGTDTTYCEGAVAGIDLADIMNRVSLEGVAGTWSPDTIDASTPTPPGSPRVYTFTPLAGQCVTGGATFTVTVMPNLIPTFSFGDSVTYCAEDTLIIDLTQHLTSSNGVHGIWMPEVINVSNTVSDYLPRDYIFTPTPGQCATGNATLTVTVNPNLTPTFPFGKAITYCVDDTPIIDLEDPVNMISTEGITGTWSDPIDVSTPTDPDDPRVYIFMPDPGQCVTGGTTFTVTVEECCKTPPFLDIRHTGKAK